MRVSRSPKLKAEEDETSIAALRKALSLSLSGHPKTGKSKLIFVLCFGFAANPMSKRKVSAGEMST